MAMAMANFFVTQMLTRDLFAIANLQVFIAFVVMTSIFLYT